MIKRHKGLRGSLIISSNAYVVMQANSRIKKTMSHVDIIKSSRPCYVDAYFSFARTLVHILHRRSSRRHTLCGVEVIHYFRSHLTPSWAAGMVHLILDTVQANQASENSVQGKNGFNEGLICHQNNKQWLIWCNLGSGKVVVCYHYALSDRLMVGTS